MTHRYFSQRSGLSPDLKLLSINDLVELFIGIYNQLQHQSYFNEAFGFHCTDDGEIAGKVKDINHEIFLTIKKNKLWPVSKYAKKYSEDDLFDIIEFLYLHISKPTEGYNHQWNECGMHWQIFDRDKGRQEFKELINNMLKHYENCFELSENGEILHRPDEGFELIFKADIPSSDNNVVSRVSSAISTFRRHGSSANERRQAVRDLADVLEYLRPQVTSLIINKKDESDLFNIANNFGIRHHNDKQKTSYDTVIWLSWMFYFYLSTIHVILRKIKRDESEQKT